MSFSADQARSFIDPIVGKTATFLLDTRGANLSFARAIATLAARTNEALTILDIDAFYSSNSDRIFGPLSASARWTKISVPEPGPGIERDIARVFVSESKLTVIDSLNSLHHQLSPEDGWARSRKLSFIVGGLSYIARAGRQAIILAMYRREGFSRTGSGRSISALSDVTASVEESGSGLSIRCTRGTAWPDGRISLRIP